MNHPNRLSLYLQWLTVRLALLVGIALQTGCYYQQAATGQARLLLARESVDSLLADPATDPQLRDRLAFSQRALTWIEAELGVDAGRRYRAYVELEQPYVVWNVVAAPALSVEPERWCFPVAGCVSYRGYFHQPRAQAFGDKLRRRGLDVRVAGTTAYSTLGWFADPLLSTFIHRSDAGLLALLAHELTHSRLYVPGEPGFNEALASMVERELTRQWLIEQGRSADAIGRRATAFARASDLLARLRAALKRLYRSDQSTDTKLARKAELFGAAERCYAGSGEPYTALFDGEPNNARVVSVATYWRWIPAFERLFELSQRDWPEFFARAEALAARDDLRSELSRLAEEQKQQRADDEGTEQIQCEALAHHARNVEATG